MKTDLSDISVDVAQVAKVAYEALRAFNQTIGNTNIRSWEDCEQAERDVMLQRVIFRLNNPGKDMESREEFLFTSIVEVFCAMAHRVQQPAPIQPPTMQIKAGEKNDPTVEIGGGSIAVTPELQQVMATLGFKEAEGSFVYNANGRAIWFNPKSSFPDDEITRQIVECAEAIGARTEINEIRKALGLPFEPLATMQG